MAKCVTNLTRVKGVRDMCLVSKASGLFLRSGSPRMWPGRVWSLKQQICISKKKSWYTPSATALMVENTFTHAHFSFSKSFPSLSPNMCYFSKWKFWHHWINILKISAVDFFYINQLKLLYGAIQLYQSLCYHLKTNEQCLNYLVLPISSSDHFLWGFNEEAQCQSVPKSCEQECSCGWSHVFVYLEFHGV